MMPGYRGKGEVGRMDSHGQVEIGHRGSCGCCCGGKGHLLMSLRSIVLVLMIMLIQSTASDPCSDRIMVDEAWRDVTLHQGTNTDKCDLTRFEADKWYLFINSGKPAAIPTECIKSNKCGAKIAMRVDLNGQLLPQTNGQNISAALCGAYDVLGKYDCCVLRSQVNIMRCDDETLIYNFPSSFDRCPVAVCIVGNEIEIPPEAIARMGDDISKDDAPVTDAATLSEPNSTAAQAIIESITSTAAPFEESTEFSLAPEAFMEKTTVSDRSALITGDSTQATDPSTESTATVEQTNTSNKVETHTDNQQDDTSTTESVTTETVSELSEETELPLKSSLTSTVTSSPPLSQDINATTETTVEPPTSHNVTSQTVETSSLSVLHLSSEISSDLSSTIYRTTDDLLHVTDQHSDDLISTISSDTLSTTERSSSDETSSRDETSSDVSSTTGKASSDGVSTSREPPPEATDISSSLHGGTESTVHRITDKDLTDTTEMPVSTSVTDSRLKPITDKESSATVKETFTPTSTDKETSTITTTIPIKTPKPKPKSSTTSTVPTSDETVTRSQSDVTVIQTIRFVFTRDSTLQKVNFTTEVYTLIDNFFKKTSQELKENDNIDWAFQLQTMSGAMNHENSSIYVDIKVLRMGPKNEKITTFFDRFDLSKFIFDNSAMTLIAACPISDNCQVPKYEGAPLASVFKRNAPAIITAIVICCIFVLLVIAAVMYARLSKRGSWKAPPETDKNNSPDNRHYYQENQSPFTDAEIMKDEMVEVDTASFNDSAKDGDTNLSGTWVIPLDQDGSAAKAEVSISTEDTQF